MNPFVAAVRSPPYDDGVNSKPEKAVPTQMKNNTKPIKLTLRQIETLHLIADGHTTREISAMMSITEKTVQKHRQAVMDRLDIHQIATLTRYAVSTGVVEVNWTRESKAVSCAGRTAKTRPYERTQKDQANGDTGGLRAGREQRRKFLNRFNQSAKIVGSRVALQGTELHA